MLILAKFKGKMSQVWSTVTIRKSTKLMRHLSIRRPTTMTMAQSEQDP